MVWLINPLQHMALIYFIVSISNNFRAQTNTRLFGEYSNIWLFDYDFEYSNNRFKGNTYMT